MSLDNSWFSEVCESDGTAFSLKINQKLHEEQTKYQKIEIFSTEKFGNLMVIDGFIMLSQRDNFIYHEMMSHPVMFTHHDPKNILIIGGGDCGTLQAVLQHPEVESVQQIEIDEQVTRLSEIYFPELCGSNADSRVSLIFVDGIQWVNDAPKDSYDVIIIDSTDPIGPAAGLFSSAFYTQCCRVLRGAGILVQQSESPLFHLPILGDMMMAMKEAGFQQQKPLFFPQCVYPSGWWSATMATKHNHQKKCLTKFRDVDAEKRYIKTNYYNAGIHQAALMAPEFFNRIM